MTLQTSDLGRRGEQIAVDYLKDNGFSIRIRNFRSKFGEIDIIAEKNGKLHFIEVKTRTGELRGKPYESVTKRKISHLKLAIQYYILKYKVKDYRLSLDVVSLILTSDGEVEELKFYEGLEWR